MHKNSNIQIDDSDFKNSKQKMNTVCSLLSCGNLTEKPRIPYNDRFILSPWQKWKKYKRFPWKVLLHIAVMLLCTLQAAIHVLEFSQYTNNSYLTFKHYFTPPNLDPDSSLYGCEKTKKIIQDTINNYFDFNMDTVDRYEHFKDKNGNLAPVEMIVRSYKQDPYILTNHWKQEGDLSTTQQRYFLQKGELGPLNVTGHDLQNFFFKLTHLKIIFAMKSMNFGPLGPVLFLWNISQDFDFSQGTGRIPFQLFCNRNFLAYLRHETLGLHLALDCLIALFCTASFILSLRALIKGARFFLATKRRYKARATVSMNSNLFPLKHGKLNDYYTSWNKVPLSVKMQFFDSWHIVICIGDILLIASSFLGAAKDRGLDVIPSFRFTFALGTMFAYLTIIRYLEFAEKFYILIYTLRACFGNIIRFLISIAPIFFAYATFGVIMYSEYSALFVDFNSACATLFSLLNGDSLLLAFTELEGVYQVNPIISRIYLYSFNLLFITAILNIFIFIIEDAFHVAKIWNQKGSKKHENDHDEDSHGSRKLSGEEFDIKILWDVLEVIKQGELKAEKESMIKNDKQGKDVHKDSKEDKKKRKSQKDEEIYGEEIYENKQSDLIDLVLDQNSFELNREEKTKPEQVYKSMVVDEETICNLIKETQESIYSDVQIYLKQSQAQHTKQLEEKLKKLLSNS